MRYIQDIEDQSSLRALICQDLKDLGIKPPKTKKPKSSRDDTIDNGNVVFGNSLCQVPCEMLDDCGAVPRFLVEATDRLSSHLDTEGLFRKSGSIARQKEIRDKIDMGFSLGDGHPFDICALMKQFLRELPDPLVPARFHDTFLKCQLLENDAARCDAILLMCLLLPWHHMSTLRFIMLFLKRVALVSDKNKMDSANLAVCLAPNILNRNQKVEKMNICESGLLQAQTSVVQMLIIYADDIGMVSDNLYERTTYMTSYLPYSEDELEKSDECADDSKGGAKKKKKRSASLQGLVNNLSNSFTRWRRNSNGAGGHNCSNVSDKSTISTATVDQVDTSTVSGDSGEFAAYALTSDITPKVMRKRKASTDMIAFSATKKKAILQQMPHMSTLGNTPFTPHARPKVPGSRAHDFGGAAGTPSMRFCDSQQMVFNATSEQNPATQTGATSHHRRQDPIHRKCKRHSGKHSSLSKSSAKTVVKRKSVKGFFRRLSGGKDSQSSGDVSQSTESLDGEGETKFIGQHGGAPIIIANTSASGNQKKKGLFKRHKKTPSSPARLLTSAGSDISLDVSGDGNSTADRQSLVDNCTECRALAYGEPNEYTSNLCASKHDLDLGSCLQSSMSAESMLKDSHCDQTPVQESKKEQRRSNGNTSLRRGKPNTVKSGLPPERYIPSPERCNMRLSFDDNTPLAVPIRQSSKRNVMSPGHRGQKALCDVTTFDTSPILKTTSPDACITGNIVDDVDDSDGGIEGRDESVISSKSANLTDTSVTRQLSTCSIASAAEDFDCAFLQESFTDPKGASTDSSLHGEFKCPEPPSSQACQMSEYGNTPQTTASANTECTSLGMIKAKSDTDIKQSGALDTDRNILSAATSLDSVLTNKDTLRGLSGHDKSRLPSVLQIPNLPISAEMQQLLSRVTPSDGTTPAKEYLSRTLSSGKAHVRESVANLLDVHKGKVADSVRQFSSTSSTAVDSKNDVEDNALAQKHASPLRFPATRRGNSPIRIPTIFTLADSEAAEQYRKVNLSTPRGKANLPISTSLLRTESVKTAKAKMLSDSSQVPSSDSDTITANMQALKDCSNLDRDLSAESVAVETTEFVPATPKIRASLVPKGKNIAVSNTPRNIKAHETPKARMRTHRSPVKPVKRLRRSPQSPKATKHRKSPNSSNNRKHGLSPIPTHMADWNV